MSMLNAAQQRDLADLRQAATDRDHQQLQFIVKKLLSQLDFYVALALTLEHVYTFIDLFESYYPDETWIRKMLVSIASFGVAPDDSVAEMALSQQYDAPGCGNFLKAVYDVTQAMQKKHTSEARVGFMTSALVNVIMAELVEAWYGEDDDLWQTVRADQTAPDAMTIAYAFWTHPDTMALDTASWLEVADNLEKHLLRSQGRP